MSLPGRMAFSGLALSRVPRTSWKAHGLVNSAIYELWQHSETPIKLPDGSGIRRINSIGPLGGSRASFSKLSGTASITKPTSPSGSIPLDKPARTRGDYKSLTLVDIEFFKTALDHRLGSVISSLQGDPQQVPQSELDVFNHDWMGKYSGQSKIVLKPKTTEEVSKLVAYCVQQRLAICPQGGNTGLVGGSVPVFDEVILNLGGLSRIRSFDDTSGILTTDAGCILQTLDEFLNSKGYIVPLDLGAKGSCQIGGNIATNAGGLRLLRYGSLHGSVLGLEVVLPDGKGTVLSSGMKGGLRKDNTGYDLKQLFIGSEGTLGIITGACILTPKRSTSSNVALLSVADFGSIAQVFSQTRTKLGEILSAFEFFDQECFDLVVAHTNQKKPFESPKGSKQFYVLIETSGSNKDHDDEKLAELLESLLDSSAIADGVLAQDQTQFQSLWSLREQIPEAVGKLGKAYKYDLSLPVSVMYDVVEETRKRFVQMGLLGPGDDKMVKAVMGYGHFGDGNLHVNIVSKQWDSAVERATEPWIYEWVSGKHGSISAEHGLGLMKAPYIGYSKDATNVQMMRQIKQVFDPHQILNPGKYVL